ncbi:MAG: NAD(P)H-binding protein [Stackebrandtia sp.]
MRVVIAGGHGKIALRLERLLADRGDRVEGLIRNPGHAADLRAAGAEPVLCDLEAASVDEVAARCAGADALVFAAGAGPGSGAARKTTVDLNAAVLLADAAEQAKVARYVMVSAIGAAAPPPEDDDSVFAAYLRAKAAADDDLRARLGLDWTVVRPGSLTDEPGTGLVTLTEDAPRGDITRDDVAAVLAEILAAPGLAGRSLNLVAGTTPIPEAVSAAAR